MSLRESKQAEVPIRMPEATLTYQCEANVCMDDPGIDYHEACQLFYCHVDNDPQWICATCVSSLSFYHDIVNHGSLEDYQRS